MNGSVPPGTLKREISVARTRKSDPKPADAATGEIEAGTDPRPDAFAAAGNPEAEVTLPPPAAEPPQTSAAESPPPPPRETVRVERRGGFVPLILGGILAGGLGFGAAAYVIPRYLPQLVAGGPDLSGDLQAQADRIAALDNAFAALKEQGAASAADASGELARRLDELGARLTALDEAQATVAESLGAFDLRLAEIERRPLTGDAGSAAALAAINRELDGFRTEMAAQIKAAEDVRTAIATAADAATKKVETVEKEAERIRSEAEAAARAAAVTGGVARILAALESGAALDQPISELKAAGYEVPEALVSQAQGVPTLAALRDSFPEAARSALAVSVPEAAADDLWSRIAAFFRSQSGARSLAPRAGEDPDAVLSRAEADLRAGDLAKAIDELQALPEPGRAAMAEWVAKAGRRLEAVNAARALEQQVK